MKNKIVISFFLIISSIATAQEIEISGNVFQYTRQTPGDKYSAKKEVPDKYEVWVVDMNGRFKLILKSNKSFFRICFTQKDLENIFHLEFKNREYTKVIELEELMNLIKANEPFDINLEFTQFAAKPAIYLYPEKTQEVVVEHIFKGKILNTYPKYDKNWKVMASPNGVLLNTADNRKYNYLFWDGTYTFPEKHYVFKTGFYIERDKSVQFLQEKLAKVGLNETEINDFVVYWLPQLSKNEVNFIHFWINDNIDNSSVLTITPKPQTSIRLFMEFEKYTQGAKKLPEQKLPTFQRKGFTMVEWGGSNIGSDKME
jgi:hypothetical protein